MADRPMENVTRFDACVDLQSPAPNPLDPPFELEMAPSATQGSRTAEITVRIPEDMDVERMRQVLIKLGLGELVEDVAASEHDHCFNVRFKEGVDAFKLIDEGQLRTTW